MMFSSPVITLAMLHLASLGTPVHSFAPLSGMSGARRTTKIFSEEEQEAPEAPYLDPAETAVLFCKYQNDFASEGGKIYDTVREVIDATNMLENSQAFMEFARNVGCTIVHCPISLEPVRYL